MKILEKTCKVNIKFLKIFNLILKDNCPKQKQEQFTVGILAIVQRMKEGTGTIFL